MKRAILIVDHGSRRAESNAVVEEIAEQMQKQLPDCVVRYAHLELAKPKIAEAVRACAEAGATELIVHPFFLAPGNHAVRDVPHLVEEACKPYPQLRYRVTPALGPHPKLAEILFEQLSAIPSKRT